MVVIIKKYQNELSDFGLVLLTLTINGFRDAITSSFAVCRFVAVTVYFCGESKVRPQETVKASGI